MIQKFLLLLAFLVLGSIATQANNYILIQAHTDANGTYLASDSANWTTDGVTSLTSKPKTTAADNVTIPSGVNIAWDLVDTIGTLILNGNLRFGASNPAIVPGTTAANGVLTISALQGNGWLTSNAQSYGIRMGVQDAVVNFSGTVTGHVLGFGLNGSIKLTANLNFKCIPSTLPNGTVVVASTFNIPSATKTFTAGVQEIKNGDSIVLPTALAANIIKGTYVPVTNGIAPGTFVDSISVDRKTVYLSKHTIDTLKASTIYFSNNYIDLNGYSLTINGDINSYQNTNGYLYFKTSAPGSSLTIANNVATPINFADGSSLESLTVNTSSTSSSATVSTINATNLSIANLNLVAG